MFAGCKYSIRFITYRRLDGQRRWKQVLFFGISRTDFDNESGALIIITVIWESVFKKM